LQALPSVFGGFHEPVPAVLAEAQRGEGELLREEVSALARPLASFSRGRVALIGDAAHPLPPNLAQGAAVAIEDAEALARALAASPENLGAALCAYDAARLPRVAACRRVTNMTRAIAAAPEAAALMQWVPAKVNTAVFDAFLRYSLTARV
jgi:2-polyprenyl-6-methoxyphenol hydroxylase-like FAD-dependent oxidoreductase